jgi:uncharacterized coiled-coil DUF342 family protein
MNDCYTKLTDRKYLEDKLEFELSTMKTKCNQLSQSTKTAQSELSQILAERDKLRTDVRELATARKLIIEEKDKYAQMMKEVIHISPNSTSNDKYQRFYFNRK